MRRPPRRWSFPARAVPSRRCNRSGVPQAARSRGAKLKLESAGGIAGHLPVSSPAPYPIFYGASMAHQPVAPYKKVATHGVLWRRPFIPPWGMAHLWRNGEGKSRPSRACMRKDPRTTADQEDVVPWPRHAVYLPALSLHRPPAVACPDGDAADLRLWPRAQPAVQSAAPVPSLVLAAIPHCRARHGRPLRVRAPQRGRSARFIRGCLLRSLEAISYFQAITRAHYARAFFRGR
jgi:hypothetical protein